MVKMISWKTLMTQISAKAEIEKFSTDVGAIDTLLNVGMTYSTSPLKLLLDYVTDSILTTNDNGLWAELDIWLSSFKENDKRFIYLLSSKLREYIKFYNKILTDAGVQRNLIYAKTYSNSGSASSVERGTNSATPQNSSLYNPQAPESDALFDEAIANYASEIDKNKASSTTEAHGGSTTGVTGVTWEEQKKNLQLMFYNELKDYIMSIPERIYSAYALETMPAPALFIKMLKNYKEVANALKNE